MSDELERLREENEILRKAVGEENRANRLEALYESAKEEIQRLTEKVQDLQAYAEQDSYAMDNMESTIEGKSQEIERLYGMLLHSIYCPRQACPFCSEIEKEIRNEK